MARGPLGSRGMWWATPKVSERSQNPGRDSGTQANLPMKLASDGFDPRPPRRKPNRGRPARDAKHNGFPSSRGKSSVSRPDEGGAAAHPVEPAERASGGGFASSGRSAVPLFSPAGERNSDRRRGSRESERSKPNPREVDRNTSQCRASISVRRPGPPPVANEAESKPPRSGTMIIFPSRGGSPVAWASPTSPTRDVVMGSDGARCPPYEEALTFLPQAPHEPNEQTKPKSGPAARYSNHCGI